MDERRLAELFQDAADDAAGQAPPAGFDHADVLAGARRALQRRRRVAGGVAVAAVALAAAGLAGAGVLGSPAGTSSTLAGPAPASAPQRPGLAPEARSAHPPEAAPYAAPAPRPRQATPFGAEKRGSSQDCARLDAGLLAQLTAVLPAVKGATARPPSDAAGCPAGGRGVEVDVDDAGIRGTLRVVFAPPGASLAPGAAAAPAATRSVRTRDGGRVTVTAIPTGAGTAPFAARLDQIAADLAARL